MIKDVIKWSNGMVMVFNENGEQMGQFQGKYEDVKERILKNDASKFTEYFYADWRGGLKEEKTKETW